MSKKEEQILKNIADAIPKLSESEKEKFLSFSEGMAFKAELDRQKRESEEQ